MTAAIVIATALVVVNVQLYRRTRECRGLQQRLADLAPVVALAVALADARSPVAPPIRNLARRALPSWVIVPTPTHTREGDTVH